VELHAQTAFVVIGFLYIALPFTAWTIVRERHGRLRVSLWCTGTLIYGFSVLLIGLRGSVPDWASLLVAPPLGYAAWGLLIRALESELGEFTPMPWLLGVWLLAVATYLSLYSADASYGARILLTTTVHAAGAVAVTCLAYRLYLRTSFRSAALVALAYGAFALALVGRQATLWAIWRDVQGLGVHWTFVPVFVAGLIAALYGNLGYIGLALETAQAREIHNTFELAREQERRSQAELRVREQSALLEERSRLLAHREEILAALAHEVRQPLNNALAALQSAEAAVLAPGFSSTQAAHRLDRAAAVLAHVAAAVDNTLADAVLLDGSRPITRQEVDITTVLELVIGDLPSTSRHRIHIERETTTRTAAMHPGLMRLALRNLLNNALAYSAPNAAVTIRVRDSDEPLSLLIDVEDKGRGLPAEVLASLFQRGASGEQMRRSSGQGHGLGLYIVRRVAELHQGTAAVLETGPQGTVFRLSIPQDIGL